MIHQVNSFAPPFRQLTSNQRKVESSYSDCTIENFHNNKDQSRLLAIIYGWDGDDSSSDETTTSTTKEPTTVSASYIGIDSEIGPDACPPEGVEVAKSLTDDRSRMGSFARLAAAFSPPERGLSIKDIEKVEVTCVRQDQIELEAILCETYGCVTLNVPIQFPEQCGGGADMVCAIQNLDTLDIRAETMVSHMQASMEELSLDNADLDELVVLNDKFSFPNWWVATELDLTLSTECKSIQSLLNEAEFHPEIVALAQDGMEKNANLGSGWDDSVVGSSEYVVQRAKVAAVGPAGICLKVAAIQTLEPGRGTQYLDVAYPFSASVTPIKDAAALRANVLGVIAAIDTSTASSSSSSKTTSGGGGNTGGMAP